MLPVEFARESKDGRITLVIVPGGGACQTLWAELRAEKVEDAVQLLSDREDANKSAIGSWPRTSRAHPYEELISSWASAKKIKGVVWTGLQPGFVNNRGAVPSVEAITANIEQLRGEAKAKAIDYVRRAPAQIATPYRTTLEAKLGIKFYIQEPGVELNVWTPSCSCE